MTLRLVSSGDDRALEIRDHLLPLIRERGTIESQRGSVRLIVWRSGRWTFSHWTPFNELSLGDASSPAYRHAVERQHTLPDLPYGFDICHPTMVLRLLWADDGTFKVITFIRGPWEEEALAL